MELPVRVRQTYDNGMAWVVRLRSDTAPVTKAAVVLYILPRVLFFLGYSAGAALWSMSTLTGRPAFAAGIGSAVAYDRLAAAKKKPVYTIFGYADANRSEA